VVVNGHVLDEGHQNFGFAICEQQEHVIVMYWCIDYFLE
jgi:hypothetical protein